MLVSRVRIGVPAITVLLGKTDYRIAVRSLFLVILRIDMARCRVRGVLGQSTVGGPRSALFTLLIRVRSVERKGRCELA